MKSHINNYIAKRLTELYTEAKELPRSKGWIDPACPLTHIFYCAADNTFYAAGTAIIGGNNTFYYDERSPIPYKTAIREVWNYLNDNMRTELMSTVLGSHV